MLLREAVSICRSAFKLINFSNPMSDRYLAAELKNASFLLIQRQTSKRKLLSSPNIFTEISCLQMEQVPLSSCCNYMSPCLISRSKQPLPKFGENIYGVLVQGVYSIDGKTSFKQSDPNRYVNYLNLYPDKINQSFFWIDTSNYLVVTTPDLEMVKIVAFFEEDIDLTLYTCDSPPECNPNPLDLEFKCPGYLMEDVINMVKDTVLRTYKQSKENGTSNDLDTSR